MPGTRPPSVPQLVGSVVGTAAAVALLLLWLTLRPPPIPYQTPVAVMANIGALIGVTLVLAGLVRLVEMRFEKRYDASEKRETEHRERVESRLKSLDDRAKHICRQQRQIHARLDGYRGEINVLSDGLDELRQAFVEEGLPRQR